MNRINNGSANKNNVYPNLYIRGSNTIPTAVLIFEVHERGGYSVETA